MGDYLEKLQIKPLVDAKGAITGWAVDVGSNPEAGAMMHALGATVYVGTEVIFPTNAIEVLPVLGKGIKLGVRGVERIVQDKARSTGRNIVSESVDPSSVKNIAAPAQVGSSVADGADLTRQTTLKEADRKVVMNSGGDRLAESMGPARGSAELQEIEKNLHANGVDIRYSTNEFSYGPSSTPGKPGSIVFDPDASISSVRHEYGHFLDDKNLGFPGFRFYFENPQFRTATERRQYLGELKTARELKDNNAREMLIRDYLNERQYIIDTYYFTPDGTKIPYGGPLKK